MKERKINTYLQIKQWHALPSHFVIDFLNFVKVPGLFISSFRILISFKKILASYRTVR